MKNSQARTYDIRTMDTDDTSDEIWSPDDEEDNEKHEAERMALYQKQYDKDPAARHSHNLYKKCIVQKEDAHFRNNIICMIRIKAVILFEKKCKTAKL